MIKKYQAGAYFMIAAMLMTGCGGNGVGNPSGTSGSSSALSGSSAPAGSSENVSGQAGAENGQSQQTPPVRVEEPEVSLNEMKVEDYVTLGDYQNLEVTVDANEVNAENVYALLNEIYVSYVDVDNGGITDRAVKTGDTVVIDYVGKKDGVAFAGGTAEGADLLIGSGQYIAGFEDGLIGVMPGQTVDLNLTFPENYDNTELAGQAVVFTVTVQFIRPAEVKREDMLDEVAVTIATEELGTTEISTIAGLEEYLEGYLDYRYTTALQNSIRQKLIEGCTFGELPQDMLAYYKQTISDYYDLDNFEALYGYSADTYFSYYFGMTAEQYVTGSAEASLKRDLAFQAIANAEDLKVSDEELQIKLEEYAATGNYASVEEFMGETSREDWRNTFMNDKVMEFLKGKTVIK